MNYARKNASLIFEHVYLKEADEDDVEVIGFEIKDTLQPDIWTENNTIAPEVLKRLEEIAGDFVENLPFDADIEDIRLTGSLASYNWSRFSDVDLHIVMDFSKINEDIDLVRDYFNAKQAVWNLRHEIYIYEYEVEIYAENVGDDHKALGRYSILNDEWIETPDPEIIVDIDTEDVKKKAAFIMSQIEHVEDIALDDPLGAERLSERIKEKIRKMRRSGLNSEKGIYSVKNIAFKVLRRNGYLKRLSDIKTKSYDRAMTLSGF